MKTALLYGTNLALFVLACAALKGAAPDLPYWHQMLVILPAYFAGAVMWSIKP